jgi:hypothetical protein
MLSPCCMCVCVFPLINFWMPESISMKFVIDVYLGTWAHHNGVLHKSLPSFCVSAYVSLLSLLGKGSVKCSPPFVAKQRPSKHVLAATNTRNNRRIVGRVCLWVCLCIPLSLLGNNSGTTYPQQRRIVGGVVFYEIRVVSKDSRWLVLPRTTWLFLKYSKRFCLCN